jgi:ATP-dependent protease Clp ATPase subunit
VQNLIAGPKVYICDECVDACLDILSDEFRRKPEACSLCGVTNEMQAMARIEGRRPLCKGCLEAVASHFRSSGD